MVSTPKTSNTLPNEPNSKVNIMSPYQDFGQYIDPLSIDTSQEKSGIPENYYLFDYLTGNDLFQDDILSPLLTSSVTTPSIVVDGMSTPRDLNDSPLFSNQSFVASPSLEPPTDFFPDLTPVVTTTASSLMQQLSIAPSVTIPMDDSLPMTTIHGNSSPSLNIPWGTETTNPSSTDDLFQDMSSTSPYMSSNFSSMNSPKSFMSISSVNSPKSSFVAESQPSPTMVSSTISSPSSPTTTVKPTTNKLGTRHRKRSIGEIGKDPMAAVDELAVKRAKNTDAARRSRLRKLMKMEALEKQVMELKKENTDLQTRIAVLESEKKGLEDKNAEKDVRLDVLEQKLSEAHERLIKKS